MKNISPPSGQDQEPTKEELQLQMEDSRERLAQTVGEIIETVEEQYLAAKETITGVLDYREQFSKEPLVWSLGALSAGFALGYTMGYAHKLVGDRLLIRTEQRLYSIRRKTREQRGSGEKGNGSRGMGVF